MKSGTPARPGLRRFGVFELDESSGELRRNGTLIHLPPQPLQILKLLIGNAGEVVDRDRIRREVWGATAVDFDRSLNVAVAQIRSALNDDAASPRFVQTLPRRGYRFLAEVEGGGSPVVAPSPRPMRRRVAAIGIGIILAAMLAIGAFRFRRVPDRPIRIAVLPFEDLSLDAAEAARSVGLFDDLLTVLGGTQPDRIEVIGRRSVSGANARGPGSVRVLGKVLNVNYVLESSVRRDGTSLRVGVRLVETGNEGVRWSATFAQDGPASAFEESVVGRVSAGVLTTLFPGASPIGPANLCRDAATRSRPGGCW
jgi:DNA-binding winged helix-turn-helix (wHTH) protein/TolB-like protein